MGQEGRKQKENSALVIFLAFAGYAQSKVLNAEMGGAEKLKI